MEKRKNNFFDWLLPKAEGAETTENVTVNNKFEPLDNSIIKLSWHSPNDGKPNLVNFLMDWEPYTIRIKDNH